MDKIILILISLSVTLFGRAQGDQSLMAKGNELYKKQQFDQAAEQYRKAADLNTKNAKAKYNLGDALYRSGKADAAQKAFSDAANNTKDEIAKSKAVYNKGVTLSSQKKLLESINAYKESLRLNSADEEARQNLQKALNELKKQQQQNQQKQNNKKQDKQQNQKQPEQQKNNSKLSQKQVEQMLNALRKDEKKIQQDLQKKNNIGKSNSKDW
ncbi:MAG: hypothetical protein AVDCRST_MAG96-3858 [uncultured Segetibacter sp.]|uniref:Uncharacterized protein n=1 Tax=uncultured Segetibacter sp. TaxID=481133 RepID=A0A6J4TYR2_9BACT|nr:MAG: hypothetical protein AVDCRST_MAG96-3858 [uncultured Segetibacter sp.]